VRESFVSVIVPFSSGDDNIYTYGAELLNFLRLSYSNFELLLIDDGADAAARAQALKLVSDLPGTRYLKLTKRVGTHIAVLAGLENSLGDIVAVVDSRTDSTQMLKRAVDMHLQSGRTIFGKPPTTKDSLVEVILSQIFNFYCKKILKLELPVTTHFRIFSRQNVNQIIQIRDRYPLLRLSSSTVGLESEPIEYEEKKLKYRRKENIWDRINEGIEIVLSTTKHPIRILGRLGVLWAVVIAGKTIFDLSVQHGSWSAAIAEISPMLILLILYVQCEYLGRVLEESQDRPLYQIQLEKTSQVLVFDDKNVESQT
jgi:polyisoprenyl-phosphate glycosyltransferase